MAKREIQRKIQRKIQTYAVVAAAYLFCCILILLSGMLNARTMIQSYNTSQATLVCELLAEKVNAGLDDTVTQIEQISYAIAGGRDTDAEEIYEGLKQYGARVGIDCIGFVDEDYHLYGDKGDIGDLAQRGFLRQAMDSRQTCVTDPYRAGTSASIMITVLVPVLRGNRRAGTIYAGLPLTRLQEYMNTDQMEESISLYLINSRSLNCIACTEQREGELVGAWDNLTIRKSRMVFEREEAYQEYLRSMRSSVDGGTVSYELDGENYTQGYERIEKMDGWYLAVEFSENAVSGDFRLFQSTLVQSALMLVLCTVAAGTVLIILEVRKRRRFETLSSVDSMTGLYNKKTFVALTEEYLGRKKAAGALVFLDVDDFKKYNDTYGHQNGDVVLKKFASEISSVFSASGYVGRYGGDEFVVFICGQEACAETEEKMSELRTRLSRISLEGYGSVPLSYSAGGACCPQHADDYSELCRCADEALYCVKKAGKGEFFWYR